MITIETWTEYIYVAIYKFVSQVSYVTYIVRSLHTEGYCVVIAAFD